MSCGAADLTYGINHLLLTQGRGQVRAAGPRDGAEPDHPPSGGGRDGEAGEAGGVRGYVT